MQDDKPDEKRASLLQFLLSKEIKVERIMFLIGLAIAMFGIIFIKNSTASFIVTAAGSILTFSVTDAIIKKVPK